MRKDELLNKWIKDELTAEELKAFQQRDDYNLHASIKENLNQFKAPEIGKIRGVSEVYEKFNKGTKSIQEPNNKNEVRTWLSVAATVIVLLGISLYLFLSTTPTTIKTIAGEKNTISLPDSSVVVLNAKSKLSFTKNEWLQKRQVFLEGEAYFKVSKGSTFDVTTNNHTITVVGTEFNVKERNDFFEVKCFEGKVKVQLGNNARLLTAGTSIKVYHRQMKLSDIHEDQPGWIGDTSNFKSVPLIEVLEELERQYSIKIITKSVKTDQLFTGGFIHKNLDSALKSITLPLDLNYTIVSTSKVNIFPKK